MASTFSGCLVPFDGYTPETCEELSDDCGQQHPSGLCCVCEKIDFVSFTSRNCACVNDNRHYHIGTLEHIARKTFCPGCRLILSAARNIEYNHDLFDEIPITVQRHFLSACGESTYSLPDYKDFSYRTREIPLFPNMESFIEVICHQYSSRCETLYGSVVAGTIIRMENAESADPTGIRSTCLDSENPVYRGRNVLPEVDIQLIKQWMQSCKSRHDTCHFPVLETSRDQNIRLIDVQELRVISATLVEKYVALSYVWGPATKPSLTQETLAQCSSPGGLKDLIIPRTISDAMQLVRYIGTRYLWVDTLCIVQDDEDDKKQQLTIMDSIYTNAELLIVAAAGDDANAGHPGIDNNPTTKSQRTEKIDEIELMTAQASVQQVLNRSTWNSRGWTFQEVILSRRALVFTESLVYWSCQQNTWREDMGSKSSIVGLKLDKTNTLWPHLFNAGDICRTFLYCQLAEAFSPRQLKEEKDVIWAFIGILRLQASHFRKGFIWGLPYEKLDATILWVDSGCSLFHCRRAHHSVFWENSLYDLQYPSWSWLSTNLPISFMDPCGDSIVSEVTWHEPWKFGDGPSDLKWVNLNGVSEDLVYKLDASLLFGSTSELEIMDYGFLHFTAQTAVLNLTRAKESSGYCGASEADASEVDASEAEGDKIYRDEDGTLQNRRLLALIESPEGKRIGKLAVPAYFFNKQSECFGEFVLLSSNAEKISSESCTEVSGRLDCGATNHVNGCEHVRSHNIMLIEAYGYIAYRVAICEVGKEDWKHVGTQVKTIFLG